MKTIRISRPWLLWGMAGLILAGFVFAVTTDSPAQPAAKKEKDTTAKTDKKTKADPKAKKVAKAEPPPATFPKRVDLPDPMHTEHITLIDEHVAKLWKKNNVYPSDRCTDYEFIRRASLDIIGRIPTVEEIRAYTNHAEKSRRSWLINALLDGKEYGYGAEYAQNFANLWTVSLMTRTGSAKHEQNQMNDWLSEQFKGWEESKKESTKSGSESSKGKKETVKVNPDWSRITRALIAGSGDNNRNAAVNYLLHNLGEEIKQDPTANGKWDMVPATSRTTRLFLGIRTQCVQCHDHPFNGEWLQHHFWGINAFFRQVEEGNTGIPSMMMAKKKLKGEKVDYKYELRDNPKLNGSGMVRYERRNTVILVTDSSFLNDKKIPKSFKGTRREALADFVIASPWFSKAFVNRTWGHFFGSSFIKGPVDDFHEANPISHPELLDALAKDWAERFGHNPKMLVRWICNSQAYGLSSKANRWNDHEVEGIETLFARMLLKPLTPEAMYAAVTVASHPNWQRYSDEMKRNKLKGGEAWYKQLVTNFGNDEGEEGSYTGTVVQALLLMNGQETNKVLIDKEGTVAYSVQKRGAAKMLNRFVIEDLFMHALGRPASKQEMDGVLSARLFNFRLGSKTRPDSPGFWTNYYQDVMWALLNSNEFILNH
jgi:hypothetical protein